MTIISNNFVYSSRTLYDRLPSKSKAYVTGVFNDLGFNYCFLYNLSAYKMEVPDNYSKKTTQELIKKYTPESLETFNTNTSNKPNVIFIMNEAFSDISLDKVFNFTEEDDPLKNFKTISTQKNAISGHLIVPNFGGGTANTEFDVLTGMQTINLNTVPTSAFRLVRKDIKSIARIFTQNSYQNLFIHPGDDWFYNRTNVYRFMGMDNQIFIDKFKKPDDLKGNMISDKATGAKIIDQFEQNIKSNNGPLFNYTVTIQNHMPYTKNKYASYKIRDVATTKKISDESKILLSNYFEGVRDADALLKELTDYFMNRKEPVVLVFLVCQIAVT
jgi:phosphoglycerol transferase MdoB-like AlkP superfamily enzyme